MKDKEKRVFCEALGLRIEAVGLCRRNDMSTKSYRWTLFKTTIVAVMVIGKMFDTWAQDIRDRWHDEDMRTWDYTIIGDFARLDRVENRNFEDKVVTIPSTIPSWCGGQPISIIGYRAFENCSMKGVVIPNNVKSIEGSLSLYGAFCGCKNLNSVTISANVTNIGIGAFANCQSLNGFNVSTGNPYYMSESGFLLTKDGTTLITAPGRLTNVTLPNSIMSIGSRAFDGCSRLTNVSIPNGVTNIDTFAFRYCNSLTNVSIPPSVIRIGENAFQYCSNTLFESETIPGAKMVGDWVVGSTDSRVLSFYGARGIADRAFLGASGLTSVTVPDCVIRIGADAFSGCNNLTSVTITPGQEQLVVGTNAFVNCQNLVAVMTTNLAGWCEIEFGNSLANPLSIAHTLYTPVGKVEGCLEIPERVGKIGSYSFSGCKSLTNVTMPKSVTNIGDGAFANCDGLVNVTIPSSVTSIGTAAFIGCYALSSVVIPDRVSNIGASTFSDCRGLTNVIIPDGVTSIGASAFSGCGGLKSVVIPTSVTNIEDRAFYKCSSLTNVTIPSSVISIGKSAFEGCRSLTSIEIPESVTKLGESVFSECDGLTKLVLSQSVCDDELSKVFSTNVCRNIKTIIVKDGVVRIGAGAFLECTSLTNILIPEGVSDIGAYSFYNCYNLEYVSIPESVTNVGNAAFANCRKLKRITVPANVTRIGGAAFSSCSSLESVYILGCTAPLTGESIYNNTSTRLTTYVPENSTGWFFPDVSILPEKWPLSDGTNARAITNGWPKYIVTFDTNGGTGGKSVEQDYGTAIVAPMVMRTGYSFKDWLPSVAATVPLNDVFYTAQWLANQYTVTFNANGGKGEMAGQPMVYDVAATLSPNGFVRTDAWFMGWSVAPDGELAYVDGAIVMNLTSVADDVVTLYAVWQEKPASVLACEDAFGGAGVVTLDEDGNVVVTLTNDVCGTVEIPDNVGNVTINLNGHSITGTDGGAAILVALGDGDGEKTQLTVGDTSEGGNGQIIGDGESAGIEIAEDAASDVRLDVEEGVTVLNGDGTEQEFKPKLVGTGTVTVPKTWKTGQKVTWKAKADKGSVFARWEGPLVASLNLTKNERRNPSLAFAVPEGFDTNQITAVFIPLDDDGLSLLGITQTEFELKTAADDVWVTDDSESYVTASVSGLPTGLKFDAKTLRITGAPTKGGVYWAQIKAKNASGYQWAENVKITVSGDGKDAKEPKLTRTAYYPLTVICATEGGTVSGTGVYAEGKKVAIKATAAKGYVFAGWYEDARLTRPATFAAGDWRKASQSIVVPEVRYLFAKFVTVAEDKAGIALAMDGEEMRRVEDAAPYRVCTNYCGVAVEWPLEVAALSAPTVKAAGLPTGVKLVQDKATGAYSLAGAPTAASKVDKKTGAVTPSKVKLTVTTAGKSSQAYAFDWTILPLPEWAVGTFDGYVAGTRDACPYQGLVTLTVAANGKISGKVLKDGLTWTLAATSFDAVECPASDVEGDASPVFRATVVGKSGKMAFTNEVTVAAEEVAGYRGVASGWAASEPPVEWTAWQNLWKTEPWKTEAKPFAKAPALAIDVGTRDACPYPGTVTLKFAASGAVTASGKFVTGQDAKGKDIVYSASCSSVLVPAGARDARPYRFALFLYFPPKAGKFEGYSDEVSLVWDGKTFKEE